MNLFFWWGGTQTAHEWLTEMTDCCSAAELDPNPSTSSQISLDAEFLELRAQIADSQFVLNANIPTEGLSADPYNCSYPAILSRVLSRLDGDNQESINVPGLRTLLNDENTDDTVLKNRILGVLQGFLFAHVEPINPAHIIAETSIRIWNERVTKLMSLVQEYISPEIIIEPSSPNSVVSAK